MQDVKLSVNKPLRTPSFTSMPDQIKKISLLIFSISNTGGCERITCGLANELNKRGYEISIISIYNKPTSFFPLEKRIIIAPLYKKITLPSKYHFPFVPFRLMNLLRKKATRPDVLIGVGTDMSIYALPAVKLFGIPFIGWEHFNFTVTVDNHFALLGRKLSARYARFIVVLTQQDKVLFERHLPVKGKVVCIPNFMTFLVTNPSSLSSTTAIAMGRYTYQKGFDNLIKIWDKVSPKHPEWHLQIIGQGEDKAMLEEMIQERQLGDKISLVPASQNVTEYYQQASLFLLSSRWEGLPMVTIEAKSFGLPIVSFDCDTGPRDVIHNNEDGILVTDGDNEAFASAVNDLLSNRQRMQVLGNKALVNSKQFDAVYILSLWESLFSIIKKETPVRRK